MNLRKTLNIICVSLFLISFFGAALVKCDVTDKCNVADKCEMNEKFHETTHHDEHEKKSSEHHSCEYCLDCICKGNFQNSLTSNTQSNLPFTFLKFHNPNFSPRDFSFPIEQPPQNLI